MSNSTFYQLANNISLTQVDDEAVLLNLNTGSYFGLNHVGAALLNNLVDQQSVEQSCATLAKQYEIPAQTVNDDIAELINQLLEQGLIEQQNDG